jgi:hypothetical protein
MVRLTVALAWSLQKGVGFCVCYPERQEQKRKSHCLIKSKFEMLTGISRKAPFHRLMVAVFVFILGKRGLGGRGRVAYLPFGIFILDMNLFVFQL